MGRVFWSTAIFFYWILGPPPALAITDERMCEIFKWSSSGCGDVSPSYSRTSSATNPSNSSAASSNPGAINVQDGLSVESIFYDKAEIGLTSGNGRVGGSVSSQNSEETFFGNISTEPEDEYKARVEERSSYRCSKYSLGVAVKLAGSKVKKGASKKTNWGLSLGIIGKYNPATDRISPGLGLSYEFGPLNLGVSHFYDDYADPALNDEVRYRMTYLSAGLRWNFFILDYSTTFGHTKHPYTIQILTSSIYFGRPILTGGYRWEDSARPKYNWNHPRWENKRKREDPFIGLQYSLSGTLLTGIFYNYYLVHDVSYGLTIMF